MTILSNIKAEINKPWRASFSGLSCACRVIGNQEAVTLYFPRYTKLGRLISLGDYEGRQTRPVLANYLRQELGLPRGEANRTRVDFVGV